MDLWQCCGCPWGRLPFARRPIPRNGNLGLLTPVQAHRYLDVGQAVGIVIFVLSIPLPRHHSRHYNHVGAQLKMLASVWECWNLLCLQQTQCQNAASSIESSRYLQRDGTFVHNLTNTSIMLFWEIGWFYGNKKVSRQDHCTHELLCICLNKCRMVSMTIFLPAKLGIWMPASVRRKKMMEMCPGCGD